MHGGLNEWMAGKAVSSSLLNRAKMPPVSSKASYRWCTEVQLSYDRRTRQLTDSSTAKSSSNDPFQISKNFLHLRPVRCIRRKVRTRFCTGEGSLRFLTKSAFSPGLLWTWICCQRQSPLRTRPFFPHWFGRMSCRPRFDFVLRFCRRRDTSVRGSTDQRDRGFRFEIFWLVRQCTEQWLAFKGPGNCRQELPGCSCKPLYFIAFSAGSNIFQDTLKSLSFARNCWPRLIQVSCRRVHKCTWLFYILNGPQALTFAD